MGPSVTDVLDILGELRLESVSDTQWQDLDFISSLFGDSLRPFLPFASAELLHCVSRRNLTCETYQYMYVKYSLNLCNIMSYRYDVITHVTVILSQNTFSLNFFSSVGELSHQFDHMTEEQAEGVIRFFILPFLTRNTSGQN